jgi:hypothetical protein
LSFARTSASSTCSLCACCAQLVDGEVGVDGAFIGGGLDVVKKVVDLGCEQLVAQFLERACLARLDFGLPVAVGCDDADLNQPDAARRPAMRGHTHAIVMQAEHGERQH